MRSALEIENIEELRLKEGIDDVELRHDIQELRVGDFVNLTLLADAKTFETLLVRITSIRGTAFRGKLASKPAIAGLANLDAGASIAFTAGHIHSIPRKQHD